MDFKEALDNSSNGDIAANRDSGERIQVDFCRDDKDGGYTWEYSTHLNPVTWKATKIGYFKIETFIKVPVGEHCVWKKTSEVTANTLEDLNRVVPDIDDLCWYPINYDRYTMWYNAAYDGWPV